MKIQYFENYVDYYKSNRYNIYEAHIVLVKNPDIENTYFVEKDRTGLLIINGYMHIDEIAEILLIT